MVGLGWIAFFVWFFGFGSFPVVTHAMRGHHLDSCMLRLCLCC